MAESKKQIIDAGLEMMQTADLEHLLSFMTPENLAEPAGVSSGTVRYQFRTGQPKEKSDGQSVAFDRTKLALELVDRALQQARSTVERNAAIYEGVAGAVRALKDLEQVLVTIIGDLDSYTPGAYDSIDPTAQERIVLLALACCDEDRELANRLHAHQLANTARHVRVYEAFMERTSRHVVDHTSTAQLADLISMLLEGVSMRRRFDPKLDLTVVAKAVVRIFWAFTAGDDQQEPSYEQELLASFAQ